MAESLFDSIMTDSAIPALETVFGVAAVMTAAETIGSELLSGAGWTVGANWSEAPAGTFAHAAGTGHTAALSHSATIAAATTYLLTWVMDWRTAGSVTLTIGGQTQAGVTGGFTWRLTTTSTTGLVITPTATFDGTLSGLSLKAISAGAATSGVTVMMQMELMAVGEFGERMEERMTLELAKSRGAAIGDIFTVDTVNWQTTQLLADDDYLQKFAVIKI